VTQVDDKEQLANLHVTLGYKTLNRTWAKLEILLGLLAAGLGLLLGTWAVSRPTDVEWVFGLMGLALFILGSYLALAGHRIHLYQSNNELTALLLDRIRRLDGKG